MVRFFRRYFTIIILALILVFACAFEHISDTNYKDIEIMTINGEYYYSLTDDDQLYATWEEYGVIHLFTPGSVRIRYICARGEKLVRVIYGKTVRVCFKDEDGLTHEIDLCVHKGSGIYTINLSLPDGMEAAAINKDDYINGLIRVTNKKGIDELLYYPVLIKGRGNSTWYTDKQPYVISFDSKISLTGMQANKRFVLLASHYDGTKILNKLMFDLNKQAGMEYSIDSKFADLYINGNYRGLYIVCEPVDHGVNILGQKLQKVNKAYASDKYVFDEELGIAAYYSEDNPADISGVYIIEKDTRRYYDEDALGFVLRDYAFSVKYPNNLTIEEARYLKTRFKIIDEMIQNRDPEVMEYIDVDSFVTRYLIEEFAFNFDAGITSWYFYYKSKDSKLYAGPGWDYDGSFGESNKEFLDYTQSITKLGQMRKSDEMLNWDRNLIEIPEYKSYLTDKYKQLRPLFVDLYKNKKDRYFDMVRDSAHMDRVRWIESPSLAESGQYKEYESTEKYLGYYMYNRILMMDEMILGEQLPLTIPESSNSIHTLTFCYPTNSLCEVKVKDGDCISLDQLPKYDKEMYSGWVYDSTSRGFSELLPVYEDETLYLR